MKKRKSNQVTNILFTIIITSLVTLIITILVLISNGYLETNYSSKGYTGNKFNKLSNKLALIKGIINKDYIDNNVDENELEEYAVKGYVAGLGDIYSSYYTEDEMKQLMEETTGNYCGIGVYMTIDQEAKLIKIYSVMANTPAEEVGLQAGDYIVKVEGQDMTSDDFDTIAKKIKGEENTKVKLTIRRNGVDKDYEITRKKVEVVNVSSQVLDNNIGYIEIKSFDGNVAEQFKNEYDKLAKSGITSLIVDVRNNGGGVVDQATQIGDLFTDKDQVLLIQKDNKSNEEYIKAKKDKTIDMNVVLLVNENSASASEIFAGILQDDVEKATIVGTKTYGKGVIQSVLQLSDGSGIKLTTNEYCTPKHNKINKIGITPDVIVDDYSYTGELDLEKDTQLKKAMEILNQKK